MRFHVPSLPHTQLTRDYEWCAYTQKVRKFANMMMSLGHEVLLYGGAQNEADCTAHFDCVKGYTFEERIPPFDLNHIGWQTFAGNVIAELHQHAAASDFLCIIGGNAQAPIAWANPDMMAVEFGVGYEGTFSKYRVFESYAWMHTVYGHQMGAHGADGHFYDAVIPNYFEVADFPAGKGEGDYLLYVGRLTARKGLQVVGDVAKRTGLPLIVAGEGDTSLIPDGAEYVGLVGPSQRAKLMGGARALICPTLYLEPFGGVNVEAQLCGTPVITTDWGGFTETVEQDKTGFRCRTLDDFCKATDEVRWLSRGHIRHRARSLYSTDVVKYQYQDYFERLLTLRQDGWYT